MPSGIDAAGKKVSDKKILELAIFNLNPEKTAEFEIHFELAKQIISARSEYLGLQLH